MDKFAKIITNIGVLILVLLIAAGCPSQTPIETPIDEPDSPNQTPIELPMDNPDVSASANYHIGVVTPPKYYDGEYRSARALIAQYGSVENGGIIRHIILPNNYHDEQETIISQIAELADDPLMKAVIVNQGVRGTAAGFQKIREAGRDDIILLTNKPQDNIELISEVATIIVDEDYAMRGYYDIVIAKEMGATKFVHMSFPRHMGTYAYNRRRAIYEEACKDLGIEFVFEMIPDVMGDLGASGTQYWLKDMMPHLVDKYGKNTVYFATSAIVLEPLIQRVVELEAMFVNQGDMSPAFGYPSALGLSLGEQIEMDDWLTMTQEIEKIVVEKGQSKRMGTWPYSICYCSTIGLAHLAMDMIEGRDTGDLQRDIKAAYEALTPGCAWVARMFGPDDGIYYKDDRYYKIDKELNNYFLLTMDTYIFGQGYSGVLSEPFPEKYLRVLVEEWL